MNSELNAVLNVNKITKTVVRWHRYGPFKFNFEHNQRRMVQPRKS